MPPSLTSSPPLLPRLYMSVLCNKIIKEDSALHCGRQRSPQTLETRIRSKSRQTLVFDPGGSTGFLRVCPFLGVWHAVLCGEVFVWAPDGTQGWSVFDRWMIQNIIFRRGTSESLTPYVSRSMAVSPQLGWFEKLAARKLQR